jgi:hypothetical protein
MYSAVHVIKGTGSHQPEVSTIPGVKQEKGKKGAFFLTKVRVETLYLL